MLINETSPRHMFKSRTRLVLTTLSYPLFHNTSSLALTLRKEKSKKKNTRNLSVSCIPVQLVTLRTQYHLLFIVLRSRYCHPHFIDRETTERGQVIYPSPSDGKWWHWGKNSGPSDSGTYAAPSTPCSSISLTNPKGMSLQEHQHSHWELLLNKHSRIKYIHRQ